MEATNRDMLQMLANEPLGSPELQARPLDKNGNIRAEIKEVAKRITKRWLPQGRKTSPRAKCNEPTAVQVDIEDAIVERGGHRGGANA